jgi:fructosamine-3-kinase
VTGGATTTSTRIADAVSSHLGTQVVAATPCSGGDVARSFRVKLAGGELVFAKTHNDPPPEFFVAEAEGLRWLSETTAVRVPEVLAVADGTGPGGEGPLALLVLSWVDEGPGPPDEARFGEELAALHATGAPCFGRVDRRPTGSRQLPNDPCDAWSSFYAEQRLLPLCRHAADEGALPPAIIRAVEAISADLERFGAADEAPARLHGDLWAGNRLVDRQGSSWLIDPAAHGGHREFDLAMMLLFGGFGQAAFNRYQSVSPLADGWQQRVPLHQLAPLMVHAIKFGGGYRDAAAEAVARLT